MNDLEEQVKGKKVRRTIHVRLDKEEPPKQSVVFPSAPQGEKPKEPETREVHHHHYVRQVVSPQLVKMVRKTGGRRRRVRKSKK